MVRQEQAYQQLREAVLSLALRPGEPVVETEWAERLEMSRTPVREALRRLECEGLVINDPSRGWVVRFLTLDDIEQIFDINEELEVPTVRRAAERITDEGGERLRAALEEMAVATAKHDIDAWLVADYAFHQVLFGVAGNPRLQQIVNGLKQQMHRVNMGHMALEGRMDRSLREHQQLADRILAGDSNGAEEVMRAHMREVRQSVMEMVEKVIMPLAGSRL